MLLCPHLATSQHLERNIVVVGVIVVVDVAIVQVNVGVVACAGLGRRPVVVVVPTHRRAGRRNAFSLFVSMLPVADLCLVVLYTPRGHH